MPTEHWVSAANAASAADERLSALRNNRTASGPRSQRSARHQGAGKIASGFIALALCRPEARFPLRAQVQQMFEKRQVPHSQRHRLCEILLADNEPEADYLEMGPGRS